MKNYIVLCILIMLLSSCLACISGTNHAVKHHDFRNLKVLIKNGENINNAEDGWTPLMTAVYYNYADMVKWLISMGANINWQDSNAHTPLMYAVYNNNLEIVRILVDGGANVNLKNKAGSTAYDSAVASGYQDIADYLAAHGKKR